MCGENSSLLHGNGGDVTHSLTGAGVASKSTQQFRLLPSKPEVKWHRKSTSQCYRDTDEREDPESILFSQDPEPATDELHTVVLSIKLPSGTRVQRCFRHADTLGSVVAFARWHSSEISVECEVSTSDVPKKTFDDFSLTLEEAGLTTRTLLHITPL